MKVTRVISILSLATFALCIAVGCGQKEKAAEVKTTTLRFAGMHPVDYPNTLAMKRLAENVEKETSGRIKITVYPANQLGDYTQCYEEIMKGSIDMGALSIPSQYDPLLEIPYLPMLAGTYDEAKKVYSDGSVMFSKMSDLHAKQGVKFLGFYGEGFGGFGLVKEPKKPLDPKVKKGVLLRVPPMEPFKLNAEDLGFTTVSIPYADLFTAMQTGVCQGWCGGPAQINLKTFGDVIKYYLPINQFFETTSFIMNKKLWDSLSPADQEIFTRNIKVILVKSFDDVKKDNDDAIIEMKKKGIKVIEVTDADMQRLSKYTRATTWPKLEAKFGKQLIEDLQKDY